MNLDDALQTFVVESHELLQAMEDALLDIENSADPVESINAIFRAAHTIKGSAGLFGLDGIVAFTHVMESVLDKVRDGKVSIDDDMVALLLSCGDHIKVLLGGLSDGQEHIDPDMAATGAALVERLSVYLGETAGKTVVTAGHHPKVESAAEPKVESIGGGFVETDNWHISLHFGIDVLRNGMDPLSFIRYLCTLGEIVGISTSFDAIPPAAEMDPESCYLKFEINFLSDADKATIEGAFEFVQDDCIIHILPPRSRIDDYLHLIQELPVEDMRLGEMLVRCGTLTQRELEQILALQSKNGGDEAQQQSPIGEIVVEAGIVHAPVVEAALEKQKSVKDAKAQESRLIRVDSEKLDNLINLVGELVIAGASASLLSHRSADVQLQEATSNISRLVEEIRDGALQLRMVQIGETFKRFNRVVRDVSRELGKDIELQISGAETELDKTVVDKIGDPLMHLVRNAMDHGIESAELRQSRGKPVKGTLRLNAYHDSGSIVIEVSDDGGGLNRERILKKAIDKGLVSPAQSLSDQEIYMLIFEAGFSTADKVSNLSGRGVGMDVVRRNIEALRGTCELESQEGQGSTVRIRLPLTLAIIDGFQIGVGSATYVVPLDMVKECLELSGEDRQKSKEHNYLNLRGEVLPFVRLREHFREKGQAGPRENVVVVQYGSQKAGLVVDELMGEFQAVIKPLGALFGNLKGISGSTILGTGEVALILDVPSLIQQAASSESKMALVQA
ncbi:MAG: chemotaxis protein CheA [Sulfurimicrobium sp.]|jgi:two-component system chemotaxis sensor kinase CheA|nr:chemotaxis protein CheA [Sulfurimicrobium sp.]